MYNNKHDPLECAYFAQTVALRARAHSAHRSAAHLEDFVRAFQAAPAPVRERLTGEIRTEADLMWLEKKIQALAP